MGSRPSSVAGKAGPSGAHHPRDGVKASDTTVGGPSDRGSLKGDHPLDEAIALIYHSELGLARVVDAYLKQFGFSAAHYRMLFVVARYPDLNVGTLIEILKISKQAASRPLRQLVAGGLICATRHPVHHRIKILTLTPEGRDIEQQTTRRKRAIIKRALGRDPATQAMWLDVMRQIAESG